MNRKEAIGTALKSLDEEDIALFTTGMISREAFNIADRKANFYMLGSMGLVSSVGLGIALNTTKRVVVFDGDGSILMDMGTMALTACLRPVNLIHIVFDNESYQSTGGQPSAAAYTDLSEVSRASGYRFTHKITGDGVGENEMKRIFEKTGPVFVLFKVDKESNGHIGRVTLEPKHLKERIRKAICRG